MAERSYWLRMAEGLAKAAEEARLAGDTNASLELAVVAAQYLQVARNLESIPAPPPGEAL